MGWKVKGSHPSAGKVSSHEVSIKYDLLFIIVYLKIMHEMRDMYYLIVPVFHMRDES